MKHADVVVSGATNNKKSMLMDIYWRLVTRRRPRSKSKHRFLWKWNSMHKSHYFLPHSASDFEVSPDSFQRLKRYERKCLLIIQGKYCTSRTITTGIIFTSVSATPGDVLKHSTCSDRCCQSVRSHAPRWRFYLCVILNKRCIWNLVFCFFCTEEYYRFNCTDYIYLNKDLL